MTLQEELREFMRKHDVCFFGFSNKKGSKYPTIYCYDENLKELLNKTWESTHHRITISQVYIGGESVDGKYHVSFQPLI